MITINKTKFDNYYSNLAEPDLDNPGDGITHTENGVEYIVVKGTEKDAKKVLNFKPIEEVINPTKEIVFETDEYGVWRELK